MWLSPLPSQRKQTVPGLLLPKRTLWRRPATFTILAVLLGTTLGGDRPSRYAMCPSIATEIFQGITYGCERLDPTLEGDGAFHWVEVDLAVKGIGLYVTPIDPAAIAQGRQYRLRWITDVVRREHLAVAINGTLFTSTPRWRQWSGDLANGVETVVANHVVSHVWEHTYLLWFDDELTPHLERSKPPTQTVLARAKWGIGGQGVGLQDGKVWPGSNRSPDSRTAIAIDPGRKFLFLAVAENISPHLMLEKLASLGGRDGMLFDGGSSSAMAIGRGAKGSSPVIVSGSWRPVATFFGVRTQPRSVGRPNIAPH
jgi:hypothetical protein